MHCVQLRALSASPDLVQSHSKSELLLTQVFSGLATQQQQQQGISTASREGVTVGTAAAAAAAAAAGLQASPVDPVLAQFGGKRNPARDRVFRASWEKQQLWQRQQERLQPGWRAAAAANLSSLTAGCTAAGGAAGATVGGSYAAQQAQQRRWGMTPEPYLYSNRTEAGGHLDSSSSTARPALHLPSLQHTAMTVAGATAPANQQQQQQERPATVGLVSRVHLQQLACSISRAVNLQATAMGSAGADGEDGGSSDAAAARGTVGRGAAVKRPSALGLKAGEVERLIARWDACRLACAISAVWIVACVARPIGLWGCCGCS